MNGATWIGVVRHGESTANVAARAAEQDGQDLVEIVEREADVPLSDLGEQQAESLRSRLHSLAPDDLPDLVLTSPFLRARRTAEIATGTLGLPTRVDERLRDRDLGVLDLHTVQGIHSAFPEESERRRRHGKFYYRPPGGESWTDVALRLRTVIREIEQDTHGQRVMIFAHDIIVSLTRYVLEELDESTLLADAAKSPIANASLSSWSRRDDGWHRQTFNDAGHVEDAHITAEEPIHERS